jgi:outer membrane biogenesis lipoprotein LolB
MINDDNCLLFLLLFILLACAGFIQGKPSNQTAEFWRGKNQTKP